MLSIYNTISRQVEPIAKSDDGVIRLYTCGPTVYNHAHIGNLRSYIMADVLYRTLIAEGQKVEWVMNITDIEDKIILSTIAEYGPEATVENLKNFTQKYTDLFYEDLRKVNVSVDQIKFIAVTSVIDQIQKFIISLIEKGYAYKADDGSTYFNINKYQEDFHDYGNLVGEKFLEGKKINARVKNDEYSKDNLSDFALWKSYSEDDANIFWGHEVLGKGRPGWHIECSVINNVAFGGKPVDIHTGGVDLIFPHHTNEIAQSQPFGPFVKHWMHIEHILVDNKKMAKSAHNFYTLADLEAKHYTGSDLRFTYLQSHYKTQQNFTWDSIEASHKAVSKLQESFQPNDSAKINAEFFKALDNDLGMPKALAVAVDDKSNLSAYDHVLGLGLHPQESMTIPEEIQKLIDERQQARDNKDFAKSDELRGMIEKLGYDIKDTSDGQKISQKK